MKFLMIATNTRIERPLVIPVQHESLEILYPNTAYCQQLLTRTDQDEQVFNRRLEVKQLAADIGEALGMYYSIHAELHHTEYKYYLCDVSLYCNYMITLIFYNYQYYKSIEDLQKCIP